MLEQITPLLSQFEARVYRTDDLESLSATVFYSGEPCDRFGVTRGSGSFGGGRFIPAASFDLGPGIAREMPEAGKMVERVRKDDDFPSHLNYEYLIPGKKTKSGKQKWINLMNIHINLEDEDDK